MQLHPFAEGPSLFLCFAIWTRFSSKTRLIQFKDDEFEVATAQTIDEAKAVISAGFEYIAEKNGVMLFRKPKRFVSL